MVMERPATACSTSVIGSVARTRPDASTERSSSYDSARERSAGSTPSRSAAS